VCVCERERERPREMRSHPMRREHIGGPRGTAADRGSEWWSRSRERDEESAARKSGGTEWEDWVRGPCFEDQAGSGGYLPRFLAPS